MKKRVLSLVMTLVMMVSLLPNAFAAKKPTFTDVNKDMWCYDYVEFVAKKGYFLGTTPTTFNPNGTMTRQQFVTVLARMANAKVDNTVTVFSDVPAGSYSAGSVAWAVKHGIVTGYADGTFKPTAPVTRQQMCAFMSRFMDYYTDVYGAFFLKKGTVSSFIDNNQVADYAKASVDRCRTYGLIQGYADNYFRPANTATRAHVAAVITRLAQVLRLAGGGSGGPDYTLTYTNSNDAAWTDIVEESDEPEFTVIAAPVCEQPVNPELAFVAWTDGKDFYNEGETYTVTSENGEATLDAMWVNPDDLLFTAMFEAADYANTKANEKMSVVNNKTGNYASAQGTIGLANPVSDTADREMTLNASATLNSDNVVEKVVETAVNYAVNVISTVSKATAKDEAKEAATLAKDEVREIVTEILDLIDAKEWIYGEGYKAKLENLVDEIYEEVQSHNAMYKNFKYNDKMIVSGVKVMDGNTVLFSADKTGFDGITYKRAAARTAKAVAQQLYAGLKNNYAGEDFVYDLALSATLTLDFAPSADQVIAAKMNKFSTVYNVTANLALTQETDVLGYRYNNGNEVQLLVSELMEAEYAYMTEEVAKAALSNESAKNYLTKTVKAMIGNLLTGETAQYVDKAALDLAVEAWVDANLDTGATPEYAPYYLPFDFFWNLNGKVDADGNIIAGDVEDATLPVCDNTHLMAVINDAVIVALEKSYGIDPGAASVEEAMLALIEAKIVDQSGFTADALATYDRFTAAEEDAMLDFMGIQINATNMGTLQPLVDAADERYEEKYGEAGVVSAYIENKPLNYIGLKNNHPIDNEYEVLAVMAESAKIAKGIDINAITGAAVGAFADYLNSVGLVKTYDEVKTVGVDKIVALLKNPNFDAVVAFADGKIANAPKLLTKVAELIEKIDDNASSVTISVPNGAVVTIDKATLSGLKADLKKAAKADDIGLLVDTVAEFLGEFGTTSIASFKDGVLVQVTVSARSTEYTGSVRLYVNEEDMM